MERMDKKGAPVSLSLSPLLFSSSLLFSFLSLSYLVGGVGPGRDADPELLVERQEVLGDELRELFFVFRFEVEVEFLSFSFYQSSRRRQTLAVSAFISC